MNLFTSRRQRGAVAITVALTLPVLIGFVALALDLGHLYVEKAELQNAMDACALSASRELTCDPVAGACTESFLINAENAGLAVAQRNSIDFQGAPIADLQISAADITFSTSMNSGYASRLGGASFASKYVRCTGHQTGITPWFMQVLGAGSQSVGAQAVATLAPALTSCAIPIGMCSLPTATAANPFAGLVVGQWLTSKLTASATGSFDWIDFTPPGGGTSELADILSGTGTCGVPPPPTNVGEQGKKTSLGTAWNTRFGLYKGGYTMAASPPDFTGESYTPTSWPAQFNAYGGPAAGPVPNFLSARAQHLPYVSDYDNLNINMGGVSTITSAQHLAFGADRRLVVVPIVNCGDWALKNSSQLVPVLGYACALILHPMDKDNGPDNTNDVWIEYRGKASDLTSPCATSGAVGGPGSVGPQVPSLIQ